MAFTRRFQETDSETKSELNALLCLDDSNVGSRGFSEQAWSWSLSGLGIKGTTIFRNSMEPGGEMFSTTTSDLPGKRGDLLKITL